MLKFKQLVINFVIDFTSTINTTTLYIIIITSLCSSTYNIYCYQRLSIYLYLADDQVECSLFSPYINDGIGLGECAYRQWVHKSVWKLYNKCRSWRSSKILPTLPQQDGQDFKLNFTLFLLFIFCILILFNLSYY